MPEDWRPAADGKEVSLKELDKVAEELLADIGDRKIWLFFGEMGSGKTTLIKAIGRRLGVKETMSSPTFSLVNEYPTAAMKQIYHVDLYRLKNEKEVMDIGMEEYFNSGQLCLVEWPERLGSLTPVHYVKVRITPTSPLQRKIDYQLT